MKKFIATTLCAVVLPSSAAMAGGDQIFSSWETKDGSKIYLAGGEKPESCLTSTEIKDGYIDIVQNLDASLPVRWIVGTGPINNPAGAETPDGYLAVSTGRTVLARYKLIPGAPHGRTATALAGEQVSALLDAIRKHPGAVTFEVPGFSITVPSEGFLDKVQALAKCVSKAGDYSNSAVEPPFVEPEPSETAHDVWPKATAPVPVRVWDPWQPFASTGTFRAFENGLAFGFSDYLRAVDWTRMGLGYYSENLAHEQARTKSFEKSNPTLSAGSYLAGNLAMVLFIIFAAWFLGGKAAKAWYRQGE